MSVLIKGMEMPKVEDGYLVRIISASIHVYANGDESAALYVHYKDKPPERYALVPVPPHGDLIDRDVLEQDAQKRLLICDKNDNQFQRPYEVIRAIALAPTIIPSEGKLQSDGGNANNSEIIANKGES